jgi:microsomal epoxide hydrolase
MEIQPFRIAIAEEVLDDLRERLARTRWPDEVRESGWRYGADLSTMRELAEHWRTTFDWRAQEARINSFANYEATVDGLRIHFVHERGKGPNPIPLLVTHGWPSSFVEMLELIPLLTDPASHGGAATDAFDVVVPSLPGYGFSERPLEAGMTRWRVAELFVKLMDGLGYGRFGMHANDCRGRRLRLAGAGSSRTRHRAAHTDAGLSTAGLRGERAAHDPGREGSCGHGSCLGEGRGRV